MTTKDLSVWLKKHPFSAACAGLSVLLVAGYFFRQGNVPEAEALVEQRTAESRRLKANITNATMLKEHVAALEQANAKIEQRLVRAADLARNQQYFYKIEADTGVKLADLRPGGAASPGTRPAAGVKKHFSTVPYTCTVQGTYSQLLAFLRKLEQGEHFPLILSASVSMGGGAAEDVASEADPILSLTIGIELLGQS